MSVLTYQPGSGYVQDVEVFSVSSLRKRFGMTRMRLPHRYAFGMLLLVTKGNCSQLVDFHSLPCRKGTLILLTPGQAHSFGEETDWDGWIVLFRTESILPIIQQKADGYFHTAKIPEYIHLDEEAYDSVNTSLMQIQEDAILNNEPSAINMLLQLQFQSLLLRLSLLHGKKEESRTEILSSGYQRYTAFKELVEEHYATQHSMEFYASRLKCTERSLARAAMQYAGITAKSIVTARIMLEARRLLAHSTMSVTQIAEELGFDEPTNLVKFFKREENCTPGEFRRKMR